MTPNAFAHIRNHMSTALTPVLHASFSTSREGGRGREKDSEFTFYLLYTHASHGTCSRQRTHAYMWP